jgi:hypothetical protein
MEPTSQDWSNDIAKKERPGRGVTNVKVHREPTYFLRHDKRPGAALYRHTPASGIDQYLGRQEAIRDLEDLRDFLNANEGTEAERGVLMALKVGRS